MSAEKSTEPKYTFVVSMLPAEAVARKLAAAEIKGVTFGEFTKTQAEMEGLNTATLQPGRVIGIIKAESDEALDKFNTALKKIYTPYRKGSS